MSSPWPSLLLIVVTAAAGCSSSRTARGSEVPPETPPPTAEEPRAEAHAPADEHPGHAPPSEGSSKAPQPAASGDLLALEQQAYEAAQPILERHCAGCHTSRGARSRRSTLRHLNMDSYPFGGHHAGEMGATIREVLGAAGERATMPRDDPGAVRGEELALIVAWTRAFDRSHAAGLHQHGEQGHDHGHGHKH